MDIRDTKTCRTCKKIREVIVIKATEIKWDVDCEEDRDLLPTELEIPPGLEDEDEISDYLSDMTGFCHYGYVLVDER